MQWRKSGKGIIMDDMQPIEWNYGDYHCTALQHHYQTVPAVKPAIKSWHCWWNVLLSLLNVLLQFIKYLQRMRWMRYEQSDNVTIFMIWYLHIMPHWSCPLLSKTVRGYVTPWCGVSVISADEASVLGPGLASPSVSQLTVAVTSGRRGGSSLALPWPWLVPPHRHQPQ